MNLFNRLVAFLVIFSVFSADVRADQVSDGCDWTKITKNSDGTFTYPRDLHLCVGKVVKQNELYQQEIIALNKTIELKDLALKTSEERAQLWMDTSMKAYDSLNKYESLRSTDHALYFGLGVAATVLSVWAVGQLRTH